MLVPSEAALAIVIENRGKNGLRRRNYDDHDNEKIFLLKKITSAVNIYLLMERILKNRLGRITLIWAVLTVVAAYLPRWSLMNGKFSDFGLNHGPIAHFIAYSVLVILISQLLGQIVSDANHIIIAAWLITGTFASLVELGQRFLPYRTFDMNDIWFNLAAAAVGAVLWRVYRCFSALSS
ncbi:MAG: hypothetical protein Kow0029_06950 [Candidatus Rifleibacteriota bacterium]